MAEPRNLSCFQKRVSLFHLVHIGSKRILFSFPCSARGTIPLKYVWLRGTVVLLKNQTTNTVSNNTRLVYLHSSEDELGHSDVLLCL